MLFYNQASLAVQFYEQNLLMQVEEDCEVAPLVFLLATHWSSVESFLQGYRSRQDTIGTLFARVPIDLPSPFLILSTIFLQYIHCLFVVYEPGGYAMLQSPLPHPSFLSSHHSALPPP